MPLGHTLLEDIQRCLAQQQPTGHAPVHGSFEKLFAALQAEGRIAPDVDIPTLTKLFSVIGDGMFMRRALDPTFDARGLVPAVMALIGKLLNVQPKPDTTEKDKDAEPKP